VSVASTDWASRTFLSHLQDRRSESHVSEDFQISLRLQSLVSLCSVGAARNETAFDPTQGWTLRWATYSNNGFEEGVSLTCSDELARWQKYAYGCSEIIFNPIRYWPTRGPLTKLFRNFLGSNIAPHAKYGIMGYIFSYYAISLACTASLANFVLIGVFGEWREARSSITTVAHLS
jgi:hypothetical protein